MTSALKAIVAVVPAVLVIVNMVLSKQPGQVVDWRTIIDAAIGPILVYLVPNLPKDVLTPAESEAVAALTAALGTHTPQSFNGKDLAGATPLGTPPRTSGV